MTRDPEAWRQVPAVTFSPILTGALDAFHENGYHGASVRDLARRVGISVQGIYYHHPNKESLLFALLDTSISHLLASCRAAEEAATTGSGAFENVTECLVRYTARSGKVAHLDSERRSLDAAHLRTYVAKRAEIEHLLRRTVVRTAQEGRLATTEPVSATRAILGMIQAVPAWYHGDDQGALEELVRDYVGHARRLVGIDAEVTAAAGSRA